VGGRSSDCQIIFDTCDTDVIGTTTLTEDGKTFFKPHDGVEGAYFDCLSQMDRIKGARCVGFLSSPL
jgi:hypothetical protein